MGRPFKKHPEYTGTRSHVKRIPLPNSRNIPARSVEPRTLCELVGVLERAPETERNLNTRQKKVHVAATILMHA